MFRRKKGTGTDWVKYDECLITTSEIGLSEKKLEIQVYNLEGMSLQENLWRRPV